MSISPDVTFSVKKTFSILQRLFKILIRVERKNMIKF